MLILNFEHVIYDATLVFSDKNVVMGEVAVSNIW